MPDRIRDKVMIYTIHINTTYDNKYRETDTVLKKTVDTHKILINAIKFYVCLQEI